MPFVEENIVTANVSLLKLVIFPLELLSLHPSQMSLYSFVLNIESCLIIGMS